MKKSIGLILVLVIVLVITLVMPVMVVAEGDEATLTITAQLQGSNRPPIGYNVPMAVKVYDNSVVLDSSNIMTAPSLRRYTTAAGDIVITNVDLENQTITFTVKYLPYGIFNIALLTQYSLINLANGVEISPPGNSLDMGTIVGGNPDNSVQITGADFSLLLNDYYATQTSTNWNGGRCDFNRDGQVNCVDISLLFLNYNKCSPILINN